MVIASLLSVLHNFCNSMMHWEVFRLKIFFSFYFRDFQYHKNVFGLIDRASIDSITQLNQISDLSAWLQTSNQNLIVGVISVDAQSLSGIFDFSARRGRTRRWKRGWNFMSSRSDVSRNFTLVQSLRRWIFHSHVVNCTIETYGDDEDSRCQAVESCQRVALPFAAFVDARPVATRFVHLKHELTSTSCIIIIIDIINLLCPPSRSRFCCSMISWFARKDCWASRIWRCIRSKPSSSCASSW